jgi:hypothetical protein
VVDRALPRLLGRPGDMGRENQVRDIALEKRLVRRRRLERQDVDAGTPALAFRTGVRIVRVYENLVSTKTMPLMQLVPR